MKDLEFFLGGIAYYGRTTMPSTFEFWLYPILSFIICVVLGHWGLKLIFKNSDGLLTEEFYLHKRHIWGGFVAMLGVLLVMGWYWSMGKYAIKHLESSHLLALVVCGLYAIVWFLKLKGYYNKQGITHLIAPPNTPEQYKQYITNAKKAFDNIKKGVLLLLIGVLPFLLFLTRSKTIISIVIDNSGSMGAGRSMEAALSVSVSALDQTMRKLNPTLTDVVITSFGDESGYTSFSQLAVKSNLKENEAETQVFKHPLEVSRYVAELSPNKALGLNQAIWDNYLETRDFLLNNDSLQYENRVMLIITDGIEYSREWYDGKFCDDKYGFNSFYGQNVHFIDLLQNPDNIADSLAQYNGFRSVMKECYGETNIYNGYEQADYMSALNTVLRQYEMDIRLPFWAGLLCTIYTLIVFVFITVNVKKLNPENK